jgi:hypothetical protein
LCQAAEDHGAWIALLGDAPTDRDDSAKAWVKNFLKLRRAYSHPEKVRLHIFNQGDAGDRSPQELRYIVEKAIRKPA